MISNQPILFGLLAFADRHGFDNYTSLEISMESSDMRLLSLDSNRIRPLTVGASQGLQGSAQMGPGQGLVTLTARAAKTLESSLQFESLAAPKIDLVGGKINLVNTNQAKQFLPLQVKNNFFFFFF